MMNRIVWISDIHLDFLSPEARESFYGILRDSKATAIWLTGDIAESRSLYGLLREFRARVEIPLHFVLGNHDFWHSRFETVRKNMGDLSRVDPFLNYLGRGVIVPLGVSCLVGHDGYCDGRLGDFLKSTVRLRDYRLIENLARLDQGALLAMLNAQGDFFAAYFEKIVTECFQRGFQRVYLLTHVPPFQESCVFKGKPADANWLPHFTCRAVSDRLCEVMRKYPDRHLLVLAGHTHQGGSWRILPNLDCFTAAAEYEKPAIAGVIDLDQDGNPRGTVLS